MPPTAALPPTRLPLSARTGSRLTWNTAPALAASRCSTRTSPLTLRNDSPPSSAIANGAAAPASPSRRLEAASQPWGKGGGYVNSAFNDYTDGVPAPAGEFYHPATGIYQANNTHGEFSGYSASIIANKSIGWIREAAKGGKPWMVTIGNRAPHAPFTPAPWYAEGSGEASAWIDKLIAPRCVCRAVMIRS